MNTNKKQFQLFKACCRKWQRELGLTDWDLTTRHGGIDDENHAANCTGDVLSMGATIRLAENYSDGNEPITQREIEMAAFHEVCELLLQPLYLLAQSRYGVLEEQLESERHKIIQRLTNYVFK